MKSLRKKEDEKRFTKKERKLERTRNILFGLARNLILMVNRSISI
jgi:hypothetical protein